MASMPIKALAHPGLPADETAGESWRDALADPSVRLALGTGTGLLLAIGVVHACCLLPQVGDWHGLTVLCSAIS